MESIFEKVSLTREKIKDFMKLKQEGKTNPIDPSKLNRGMGFNENNMLRKEQKLMDHEMRKKI